MSRQAAPWPYQPNPGLIPIGVKQIVDVTPEPGSESRVYYQCPEACWGEHLDAWRREMQRGNKTAAEPFPWGHCMFDNPTSYGCVEWGDNSKESLRQAWEHDVRAMLHGWDADLTREQRDAIVKATVDAKMAGVKTGASPFLACIAATL